MKSWIKILFTAVCVINTMASTLSNPQYLHIFAADFKGGSECSLFLILGYWKIVLPK
jgi:hypothetical protein